MTDENQLKVLDLSTNVMRLEDEMKVLGEFKSFKDSLEAKLADAEDKISSLKTDHEEELVRL